MNHPSSPLPEYRLPPAHPEPPGLAAAWDLLRRLEEAKEAQKGCLLHNRHPLPCPHCLGMLYGGGEEAQKIRAHFAELGDSAVVTRPDLATKRETQGNPVRAGS